MNSLHLIAFVLFSTFSLSVNSANTIDSNNALMGIQPNFFIMSQNTESDELTNKQKGQNLNYNSYSNDILLSLDNEDWINTHTINQENKYSISTDTNLTFGNEVSFAWNFTKFFKLNLNVFENQFLIGSDSSIDNLNKIFTNPLDKSASPDIANEINRSISGYKFGISSELGLGNNYKLGLNLDYGQLEGADLVGFNNNEISTTSFALGIRKSKFGASVNTDIFLEESIDIMDSSRLGFEIDWYFSDETKISLGSKQRMNTSVEETNNSLDSLTGNVQYIKFQHNL